MVEELTIGQVLDLAVKKHQEGKLEDAKFLYRKILEANPKNPDAWHLFGVLEHQLGNNNFALRYILEAIKINPNVAVFHGNLGMVYDALEDGEESAKHFQKALELNPKYDKAYLAHYNLGVYFKDIGDIGKSIEHYTKSIDLKDDFFESHWNRGLVLLLLGKFKEGWEDYEYRFKKQSPVGTRNFNKPSWDGSSLEGKKILIISEQGFGDNIQFVRYLLLVKEKGAYIILQCKKELKKLFEDFPGIDEIVEKGQGISNLDFDYYIHMMSLPKVFN